MANVPLGPRSIVGNEEGERALQSSTRLLVATRVAGCCSFNLAPLVK
jgi:hypothetical protein